MLYQNSLLLNWACWLTKVAVYNGRYLRTPNSPINLHLNDHFSGEPSVKALKAKVLVNSKSQNKQSIYDATGYDTIRYFSMR